MQQRIKLGLGYLNATALRAAIGDIQRFPSGRHVASWLGLTVREHSSGERRRLADPRRPLSPVRGGEGAAAGLIARSAHLAAPPSSAAVATR